MCRVIGPSLSHCSRAGRGSAGNSWGEGALGEHVAGHRFAHLGIGHHRVHDINTVFLYLFFTYDLVTATVPRCWLKWMLAAILAKKNTER